MPCGGRYAAGPRAAAEMGLPVPPSASTSRRLLRLSPPWRSRSGPGF